MSIDRHSGTTGHPTHTTKAPGNSPHTRAAARLVVRRADSEGELRRFEQWSAMAGHSDPQMLVDLLIGSSWDGVLGSALTNSATERIQQLLDSRGGVPAAAAARTAVLVAVVDGYIAGGIIAGPSWPLLTRVMSADHDTLMAALLKTSELQIVGVDDEHRERGVGKALVEAAIDAARLAQANIFYGQFDTEREHLTSFYRSCRLTVQHPNLGLDFAEFVDIPAHLHATAEERYFYCTLDT
ncbi:GNAT family N-acetyltransferase [Nocardia asiatica]|uniref:GNAT family N-acetyltransferase n=1 Tax=Nocardia asiatica TaxID=209252 RepID=UPI0024570EA2|nr:GNAT family N-acetyltransferase [Nocardia asiatica]